MKKKLLELIAAAREKERETLVPRVDDREPDRPGEWTTKDVLAHLTAWRTVAIGELEVVLADGPVPVVDSEDDVQNAKYYAQTHPLPAARILEEAERSWHRLEEAIEESTEDQLNRPRPRHPDQKLWQVVPNNTYFHVAQHLDWWYASQGREADAEAAAVWGHELLLDSFADDRSRGVADYNLGCFYARRGRTARALPYLKSGFGLRPDLREFARGDPDLDPIRSSAELAELLA